jgi:membrane protein
MIVLYRFPWRDALRLLRQRFREDRLGQAAGSLTFTTTIALVPLVTVALAVFTAFPGFSDFQTILQKRLVESLVPENISRQVLGYLTQFASKASRLGAAGVFALILSAVAMVFTIERTLNAIWRVRKRRPLPQKILLYWTALTLGPLLVGASVVVMTQLLQFTRDLAPEVSLFSVRTVFGLIEFVLLVWAVSALYRYVPFAQVRWTHALMGGVWVAVATEAARKLLVVYFGKMTTYSAIYGAFATVPILLIWIYAAWVIVLIGAVMVANLPKLLGLSQREGRTVGWRFQFAVEVLQQLALARQSHSHGLTLRQICEALQLDPLQLEEVLTTLLHLDWIGRLQEPEGSDDPRYVLLADPHQTPLTPLMERLLVEPSDATRGLWLKWGDLRLRDVI